MANPRWRRLLGFFGSLIPGGSWTKVRVSHEHIEVVRQADGTGLRLSQEAVETVYTPDGTDVRLSQEAVEVAWQEIGTAVRVSQECVEVIYPYACSGGEPIPPLAPHRYPIRRLRQAPHISGESRWTVHNRLQLDMEVGVGVATGLGEDPQVMLRWSDDFGKTWSNEHWVSAGRLGEFKRRAIWRRLGRARQRTYQVSMSDPVKWCLIEAYLDVE